MSHSYERMSTKPDTSVVEPIVKTTPQIKVTYMNGASVKNVYVVTAPLTINDFFHLLVDTKEEWDIAKVIYSECDRQRCNSHPGDSVLRGANSYMYSTNQTIIICTPECIDKFRDATDLVINDFNWADFPMPNDDETHDLHISGIPVDTSLTEAHTFIFERINKLINPEMYNITFPLKTREGNGSVHGYGTMEFNPQVSDYIRRLCKIAINNSRFSTNEGICRMVSCKWHNKQSYRRRQTQRIGSNTPSPQGFITPVQQRVAHARSRQSGRTDYTPRS